MDSTSSDKPELPSFFVKDASLDRFLPGTFQSELYINQPYEFSSPKGELFPPMLFPLHIEELMEPALESPLEHSKKKNLNSKFKYSSRDLFGADGNLKQIFYCNMCAREFRHKSDVIRHVNNGYSLLI
eukprot:NODE_483_length_7824_cov_0.163625.p6 type:complete len:128 gc:universal NODE_483_length_7824_cov_0.163625:2319-1936(-)